MKKLLLLLSCIIILAPYGCSQNNSTSQELKSIPDCEDCELILDGIPTNLTWQTRIAGPDEPGEPMIISGTIYKKDGKTPASDVVLYVYHTDSTGHYTPAPKQTRGQRHGHLRGWMKTDTRGRYQFTTIRPASYPIGRNPQHIHPIVKESDKIYWIDEYWFEDDPYLDAQAKSYAQNRGGSGIIRLAKNSEGVWIGERDIVLGLNILE